MNIILFIFLLVNLQPEYFKVVESNENKLAVEIKLQNYKIESERIGSEEFHIIHSEGVQYTSDYGRPSLPVKTFFIGVPPEAKIHIRLINFKTSSLTEIKPLPSQNISTGKNDCQGFYIDRDFYKKDILYPPEIVKIRGDGFIRDHRVAIIEVHPFRYNPKRKELQVYEEISFEINFSHRSETKRAPDGRDPFEKALSGLLINYEEAKSWQKARVKDRSLSSKETGEKCRLVIEEDGLYRVTYSGLESTGLNLSTIDPRTMKLKNRGFEIPIYFEGDGDGVFDRDDYFEFYGEKIRGDATYYDLYTNENVYLLTWGGSFGARMAEEDGSISGEASSPVSYYFSSHFELDSIFKRKIFSNLADPNDRWFWSRLDDPDIQEFEINIPYPNTTSDATLEVYFHGITDDVSVSPDHHIKIYLNDTLIGEDAYWEGLSPYLYRVDIPGKFLKNGINRVKIHSVGDISEFGKGTVLNWFEIGYKKWYKTDSDYIEFFPSKTGLLEFKIEGFSYPYIDLYKAGVSKFTDFTVDSSGGKFNLIFQDSIVDTNTKYIALTWYEEKTPAKIVKCDPVDFTGRADYIVITHPYFYEEAVAYKDLISQSANLYTTDDVFNEFNFGIQHPEAIKNFLRYAYENWDPPPYYCLLIGDGTWDPRDIKGYGDNFVVSYIYNTGGWGWSCSDHYYSCVSGDDDFGDIVVGRIPASTKEDMNNFIEKRKNYYSEFGEWRRDVLLIAGKERDYPPYNEPHNWFLDHKETIHKEVIPPRYDVSTHYYWCYKKHLIDEFNEGCVIANYDGHGAGGIWHNFSPYNIDLWTKEDVHLLNNAGRLPVVIGITCVSGFFDEPGTNSMGEEFIFTKDVGGIAYFGSSGPGYYPDIFWRIDKPVFEYIFEKGIRTFGMACMFGKSTASTDMIYLHNLLGDPGLELPLPEMDVKLTLSNPSVSAGDSVYLKGVMSQDISGSCILTIYGPDTIPFKKFSFPVEGCEFNTSFIISDTIPSGVGWIKAYVFSYSHKIDGIGYTNFHIESPYISNISTIPKNPTELDSVWVCAAIYDPEGVSSVYCKWGEFSLERVLSMIRTPGHDYRTQFPIPPHPPGSTIQFQIVALDLDSNETVSPTQTYHIPELADLTVDRLYLGGTDYVKLFAEIKNRGEREAKFVKTIFIKLDGDTLGIDTLFSIQPESLEVAEVRWDGTRDSATVFCMVDPDSSITESDETNNTKIELIIVDRVNVTVEEGTGGPFFFSDGTFAFKIDSLSVDSNTVAIIKSYPSPSSDQPDIINTAVETYEISLADSTSVLYKDMEVNLFFDLADSIMNAEQENLEVYMWLEPCKKWVNLKGEKADSNLLKAKTPHIGPYSVLINWDKLSPKIEARVEADEYTPGYYSTEGAKISAVLEDLNGIDVFLRPCEIKLDNEVVPESLCSFPKSIEKYISIPVIFYPDLEEGEHTVEFICNDFNGNESTKTLTFNAVTKLNVLLLANYPNPVRSNSTKFRFILSKEADDVRLKVYTTSGRMIKDFYFSGVKEASRDWNLKDKDGEIVANGLYFYQLMAKCGGKEVKERGKLAILR